MIDTNDLGPAQPTPPPPRRQPARTAGRLEHYPPPGQPPEVRYLGQEKTAGPHWTVYVVAAGLGATILLLIVLIVGLISNDRTPDNPAPSNGVSLGKSFIAPLAWSLADGFDAEADALEKGKPVGEADAALKEVFHASRTKAFAEHAAPTFSTVVKPGEEPKDDAIRKAFIKLHRDFARGLREAKP